MNIFVFIIFAILFTMVIILISISIKPITISETLVNKEEELNKIYEALDKYNLDKQENNKIDVPTYYINLERSKDRREQLENQFKRFSPNTQLTRINAIDAKFISGNNFIDSSGNSKKFKLKGKNDFTNYEIACSLSHLHAIHKAYSNKVNWALILEDDACLELSGLWKYKLSELIRLRPDDCDVIQLFSLSYQPDENLFKKRGDNYYSCVAYMLSRKAMEKILEGVDEDIITFKHEDIRSDYYIYNKLNGVNTYTTDAMIIQGRDNFSTIHPDHKIFHVQDTLRSLSRKVFNIKLEGYFDDLTKELIEKAVNIPVVYNLNSIPTNFIILDKFDKIKRNNTQRRKTPILFWNGKSFDPI